MAKREYPSIRELLDKEEGPAMPARKAKGGVGFFPHYSFGIVKFILGILLLPYVYSASAAIINEINIIEKPLADSLWAGAIAFLLIHLFIWEPLRVYLNGQRILELIFQFFRPLVKVAPYLLPVYTIILLVIYGMAALVTKSGAFTRYFLFLFGFSMALHLVFSARTLRSKQEDFLKSNYIFGFSFVYILNLSLLAFCLNLIFKEFSFVNFANNLSRIGSDVIYAVFKQLFL